MRINKYKLYLVLVILLTLITFRNQIALLLNNDLVDCRFIGRTVQQEGRAIGHLLNYEYNYKNKTYTYVSPSYINTDLLESWNWDNKIILNKSHPEYAKIHNLFCILTPNIILYFPLLLLLTCIFLSSGFLPSYLKFKKG